MNFFQETSLSLPESGVEEDDQSVDSHTVFIRILQCMVCLTRDISTVSYLKGDLSPLIWYE